MASSPFSLELARSAIVEDGFIVLQDETVGKKIAEIEQMGFPYFTEYGLDFFKGCILDDYRVRSILEASFEQCKLGHWLRYKAYPGHFECFRRGGPKAGFRVLKIYLLARGSQICYSRGSHVVELPTVEGERSLYEVSRQALSAAGCEEQEIRTPNGGLAILDARVSREIREGYAITFIFATDDVLGNWARMILPRSDNLEQKIKEMESEKIGVNFAFEVPE